MTTTSAIRKKINQIPPGELFTTSVFLDLGSRAAVDQALSREAEAERIQRVVRGVYVRPTKASKQLGFVAMPGVEDVARKIVEDEGAVLQVHGAEAARRLGLSTQMPTRHVFLTNGARHQFRLGKAEVLIKSVSPKKLALAGRPAGLAHLALLYLGKDQVGHEVLAKVQKRLPEEEFEALLGAKRALPGWLNYSLRKFTQSEETRV